VIWKFALLYIVAALLTITLRLPSELPPMDEAEDRGRRAVAVTQVHGREPAAGQTSIYGCINRGGLLNPASVSSTGWILMVVRPQEFFATL
jgi:hypothetical protein